MQVKKLDIFGFKSFASRQHINFGDGVTCVVGPNGCGKSNVVDALRWVMGEQNARHLRGGSMQDIIFCGSEKKAPLGFAEVTLTLENKDQSAPLDYNHFEEIAITRRLYKNGDSEYEINKQKVRLKDISEFFLGTGVGTKAYSIIEQGRVNEVVSAKAHDRRAIIEEAAGITKYKAKKAAAERRIEGTKINLDRIIDIKNELDSRVKMLSREKEKLDKVIGLKNSICELDLHTSSHKYLEFYAKKQYLINQCIKTQEELKDIKYSIASVEQTFSQILEGYTKKSEDTRILGSLITQHQNSIELLKKDLEYINATFNDTRNLILRTENQLKEINKIKSEVENDITIFEKDYAQASQNYEKINEELLRKKNSGLDVSARRQENLTLEKSLRNAMVQSATHAARLQEQIASLNEQEKQRQLDIKNFEYEISAKTQEADEIKNKILSFNGEYESGKKQRDELNSQMEITDSALKIIQAQDYELKTQVRNFEAQELKLTSRLKSLEEIDSHREWSESGIHALQSMEAKTLVKGIIADAIVVEPGREELVEKCLAQILDAGIIDSSAELKNIALILKNKKLASTSFYLLNDCASPSSTAVPIGLKNLTNFVSIKDKKFSALKIKLEKYFVAENLNDALDHWPAARLCNAVIVSNTGEMLLPDGRAILLGENTNKGVLKRKNNIAELTEDIKKNAVIINDFRAQLKEIALKIGALEETKLQLIAQSKPINSGLIRLEEIIKQKNQDFERRKKEIEASIIKLSDLKNSVTNSDEKLVACRMQWSEALQAHRRHEEELEQTSILVGHVDQEYEKFQTELKQIEIERAGNLEKSRSLSTSIDQAQKNLSHINLQQETFSSQIREKSNDLLILQEKERQSKKKLDDLLKELTSVTKQHEASRHESLALGEKKLAEEKTLSDLKSILSEKYNIVNISEININNTNNDIDNLCERISEKYRLNLRDHLTQYHHRPINIDEAKQEIENLRRTLDRMGGVNENAAVEYEEFNTRKNFLEVQVVDLQDALQQLESAIKKINKTTKMRFIEAFNNINKQFSRVFPRLFNGGKAELKLTDEEDLLNCGVEILAQPPGKNIGSIELMSGGEKALTAISLIMAIFLIKPSPFCLLDEVDAPLDEANVSRFSQLIKEMSERSQFIVITHNRKTMESADQLYGVTMEDAGSSKIVSVHIQEAFDKLAQKPPKVIATKTKPTQLLLDDLIG